MIPSTRELTTSTFRTVADCRAAAPVLAGTAPIRAVWSEEPVVVLAPDGPKLIVSAQRDPHRDARGRAVLPARPHSELLRHGKAGVRFDRLAIVHDLNPDGSVAALLGTLDRGPVLCSDEVARTVLGPVPDHPRVVGLSRTLDRVLGTAGGALRSAALAAGDLLDPVVFGVTGLGGAPRHGEVALWYRLTSWVW